MSIAFFILCYLLNTLQHKLHRAEELPENFFIRVCHAGLGGLCTFIFERQDDFTEILQFVRSANKAYQLHVEELAGDFKSGLSELLFRRPIKAVIIGTRR